MRFFDECKRLRDQYIWNDTVYFGAIFGFYAEKQCLSPLWAADKSSDLSYLSPREKSDISDASYCTDRQESFYLDDQGNMQLCKQFENPNSVNQHGELDKNGKFPIRIIKHWDRWIRTQLEESLNCRHHLIGKNDVLIGGISYQCVIDLTTYVRFYRTPKEQTYVFFEGFKSHAADSFDMWDQINEVEKQIKICYEKELKKRRPNQMWHGKPFDPKGWIS